MINIYELTNGKLSRRIPLAPFEKKGEYLRLIFMIGQTVRFREESPWPPLIKGEYIRLMFTIGQTVRFREESHWPTLKKGGIQLPVEKRGNSLRINKPRF